MHFLQEHVVVEVQACGVVPDFIMLQFIIGGRDISRTASRAIGPWTTTAAVRSLFLLSEPLGPKHIVGAAHAGGGGAQHQEILEFSTTTAMFWLG